MYIVSGLLAIMLLLRKQKKTQARLFNWTNQ